MGPEAGQPARARPATAPAAPGGCWPEGEWSVDASPSTAGMRKLVLKDNDAFLVSDRRGDFPAAASSELGYYHGSTRHLSRLELRLGPDAPLVLDAGTSRDDLRLEIDLTNGRALDVGGRRVPATSLHVRREIRFEHDALHTRLVLSNFDVETLEVPVALAFAADFADMFEVRGTPRARRGEPRPAEVERGAVVLAYLGLDGVLRGTRVSAEPAPDCVEPGAFRFVVRVPPGAQRELRLCVEALEEVRGDRGGAPALRGVSALRREPRSHIERLPQIRASHPDLARILDRAVKDVVAMLSLTPQGLYPYAGIPWYCAPFGRDGAWTALELLPWMPEVARGVLRFQAHHQAHDEDDFTDREPGKVLHELRTGEMANLREIPFVPYYGTADATPLFLILLVEYVRTSGDEAELESLWPHALRALEWIERWGDRDGDGFVEYERRSPIGLANQSWKDSFDGIAHADGTLARPPIAACEVQGYVHRALAGCAELAARRGEDARARDLERRARELGERLHAAFWLEDEGHYALALDGDKRPCRVLSTNAGHLLWAGAVPEASGRRTALRLTGPELSSGFGLRTLSRAAARYNPLSYHNGSVWPHDNAIVVEGLRRYGNHAGALEVVTALVEAVAGQGDARVPELWCGLGRTNEHDATPYPVACAPQAWSSAGMLALVRTLLGLRVDGRSSTVWFEDPLLPSWLDWLEVRNLPVRGGAIDFLTVRGRTSCSVEVLAKPDDVRVLVRK